MITGVESHDAGDRQLLRSWAAYAASQAVAPMTFLSLIYHSLIDSKILVYSQGLIFTQHGERLPEMVVIPFPG